MDFGRGFFGRKRKRAMTVDSVSRKLHLAETTKSSRTGRSRSIFLLALYIYDEGERRREREGELAFCVCVCVSV